MPTCKLCVVYIRHCATLLSHSRRQNKLTQGKKAFRYSYLIVDSDPGSADGALFAHVVLVRRGLERRREENIEALLAAIAHVGFPLAVEEEVGGDPLGVSVLGRRRAIRKIAA